MSEGITGLVAAAEREYSAFFRDEYATVLRTISLMVRDRARAEEITQDAFVQSLLNWGKVSRYERPDAWVRRVAIRLAVRSIRRDRLWAIVRRDYRPPDPPRSSRFDVTGAVQRLPGSQRAAIVLHYFEDRPVAEIATILGCSEATARVHLFRARRRLADLLQEDASVA